MPPVAVGIEGHHGVAVGPRRSPGNPLRRDVREGPVPLVAVDDVVPPAYDVQVEPAVVVQVGPDAVHADAALVVGLRDASGGGDLGVRPVSVVAVEPVRPSLARVRHVEIDPAVPVVVARGHRGAHARQPGHDVADLGIERGFFVDVADAGLRGHVHEGLLEGCGRRAVPRGRAPAAGGGDGQQDHGPAAQAVPVPPHLANLPPIPPIPVRPHFGGARTHLGHPRTAGRTGRPRGQAICPVA